MTGYSPGSEVERQRMQAAKDAEDAKAEAERVSALPPPEEVAQPTPGLTDAEHAELVALRAEVAAARAGNTPYQGS